MKVVVCGGAGYIGSHAVWWLRQRGHQPVVFDDLTSGHADAVGDAELVALDLCDRDTLMAAMVAARPDAVMHFAARSLVGESVSDPRRYFHDNLVGAINLLDAVRAAEVELFVFSSTASVYGAPKVVPIDEDQPLAPLSPYGDTKLAIERMLDAYASAYGLRFAALRYFNAAGAAAEHGLGERHDPETHLVPIVMQVAAGRRAELMIYGDDYQTPDGTCVRDYIHVVDLARAHLAALDTLAAAEPGARVVVNLGTGAGFSVQQILDASRRITGREIPARVGARRPGDPPVLVAAVDRARGQLGWQAELGLDEIIASAWAFERDR